MASPLIYTYVHPPYIKYVARIEDLRGEPEYLSAGPPERFLPPRWSKFRVPALGLVAVVLAALGGYWVGTTHARSGQAEGLGEVIAVPGGRPSGEGFGFGSIWVTTWSPTDGVGPGQPTNPSPGHVVRYDPATRQVVAVIQVGPGPLAAQPGYGSMWVTNAQSGRQPDRPHTQRCRGHDQGRAHPLSDRTRGRRHVGSDSTAAVKIDPTTERSCGDRRIRIRPRAGAEHRRSRARR